MVFARRYAATSLGVAVTSLFLIVFLFVFSTSIALAAEPGGQITVALHPQESAPQKKPVLVSFGFPFPKGVISDVANIRVLDAKGREYPVMVRPLLKWRNLSSGETGKDLRAVLIQGTWSFTKSKPLQITVEWGKRRSVTAPKEVPIKQGWQQVDDERYPASAGVYEPLVYVTLPAAYLSRAGLFPETIPFEDVPKDRYRTVINEAQPGFLKTAVNDVHRWVKPEEKIDYLNQAEPWLYDRATTLFKTYLRSGELKHLQAAHRAAEFYRLKLNPQGYFSLKTKWPDPKYSYGESLLANLILMGNTATLAHFPAIVSAVTRYRVEYTNPEQMWTERNTAYRLLALINAFEATGEKRYASQARDDLKVILRLHREPPSFIPKRFADDGCIVHTAYSHREGDTNQYVCSPWMSGLLVGAMQRYDMLGHDPRIADAVMRLADYVLKIGSRTQPRWLDPDLRDLDDTLYRFPYYLATSSGVMEDDPWTDKEHALDVARITALAYYYAKQKGEQARAQRYRTATDEFLHTAKITLEGWIRPAGPRHGKPVYRLSPSRKFNWWFTANYDMDYLLNK